MCVFQTRGGQLAANRGTRINERIRVREVRLIDDQGGQLGIIPTVDALRMARERDLDLVEVAPNANPRFCKLRYCVAYRFQPDKSSVTPRKSKRY